MPTREQICQSTSTALAANLDKLKQTKATVGFDGFVDEIIAVVDKRQDANHYDPVKTIAHFGQKISAAAGKSSNYELVVTHRKLGGNGPIMANALASAGFDVTYIGNLGYPALDPVFKDFEKIAKLVSIADPGHTDALEFEDGKLMLGKHGSLADVTWKNICGRYGSAKLKAQLDASSLIGMVNWTMLPHMSAIWKSMQKEIFPLPTQKKRYLFVDLADPEKRTKQDMKEAMDLLTTFQKDVEVILGLNLKESVQIMEVLEQHTPAEPEPAIAQIAAEIRRRLNIACVVVHPRRGAAAATAEGTASFLGPFVQQPMISTGAGDHFNAGFALGFTLGFKLEECLCVGVAVSGFYVRSAKSPTGKELADFIRELPPPQV